MPGSRAPHPPSDFGLPFRRGSPGLGRVTLCLPEPSQPEGDGLESDLTYPYRSATRILSKSPICPVTRILCNLSDSGEDNGSPEYVRFHRPSPLSRTPVGNQALPARSSEIHIVRGINIFRWRARLSPNVADASAHYREPPASVWKIGQPISVRHWAASSVEWKSTG
jgi:hypothetical protein